MFSSLQIDGNIFLEAFKPLLAVYFDLHVNNGPELKYLQNIYKKKLLWNNLNIYTSRNNDIINLHISITSFNY